MVSGIQSLKNLALRSQHETPKGESFTSFSEIPKTQYLHCEIQFQDPNWTLSHVRTEEFL